MSSLRVASLTPTLLVAAAAAAVAADEAPPPPRPDLHGMLSITYGRNLDDPPGGANLYRVFDTDDRTFGADAEIVLAHAPAGPGKAGFRIDAVLGSTIPRVSAATGLFRDEDGTAEDVDLQQAFVSYLAPLGRGLKIDAGKFVSHMGYESITGYDSPNDQVTRSFLFGWAVPFTQTGLRASYPLGERSSVTGFVLGGWDVVNDNNRGTTFGAQAVIAPSERFAVTLNAIAGPEQADNTTDDRRVLDLIVSFRPAASFSLGLNADYGREEGLGPDGDDARWDGAALYARYDFGPRFSLAARAEVFRDRDGTRTGTAQELKEFTLTPIVRLGDGLLVRLDARLDRSDEPVFDAEDGPSKDQTTLTAEVLYTF
jgi:hypothetical protein